MLSCCHVRPTLFHTRPPPARPYCSRIQIPPKDCTCSSFSLCRKVQRCSLGGSSLVIGWGALLGVWIGACAGPLDWEAVWQPWPIASGQCVPPLLSLALSLCFVVPRASCLCRISQPCHRLNISSLTCTNGRHKLLTWLHGAYDGRLRSVRGVCAWDCLRGAAYFCSGGSI